MRKSESFELKWAISEKIQTGGGGGGGVEDMDFPEFLKKKHLETPGVN